MILSLAFDDDQNFFSHRITFVQSLSFVILEVQKLESKRNKHANKQQNSSKIQDFGY